MRVLASGVSPSRTKKASVPANDNVSPFASLLPFDRDRSTYGGRFGSSESRSSSHPSILNNPMRTQSRRLTARILCQNFSYISFTPSTRDTRYPRNAKAHSGRARPDL
jgi:hypothetical protein